jgi:uncharacterized protein CbrC (UPF0167 family)
MVELLRTPGYLAHQGENWLFCCGGPMVYVGQWSGDKFAGLAPDQLVDSPMDGLWENPYCDETKLCAFRCATCKKYRAYWDAD